MRIVCVAVILGVVMHLTTTAEAQFVDRPAGPIGGSFLEQATGKIWLDVDNFFQQPFTQIESSLVGTPYRLATRAEVERIFAAAGQGFITEAVQQIFQCSANFTCISGFYDDSLSGVNPALVGEAQQTRNTSTMTFGQGAADDRIARDQPRIGGGWVIQRSPRLAAGPNPSGVDFDGDGIDEKVVWRQSIGTWFVRFSISNEVLVEQWGLPGDHPIAADYDGDGIPDLAVWRPGDGNWFIKTSSTLFDYRLPTVVQFGLPGDIPLRADYDADGIFDLAVWRPVNGSFYYRRSTNGQILVEQWGLPGDIPIVGSLIR